ncbi:MAG: hypothetical protein N3G18_03120 [Candidatus Saccharicenans sp.]|nr:hypothetical protein [Candidatus Saccharicenans sp.]
MKWRRKRKEMAKNKYWKTFPGFFPAIIIIALVLMTSRPLQLLAAVGCDLNDPGRDIKLLFPESTGFRTFYVSVKDSGGPPLLEKIERALGDRFSGLYETIDVPYTVYEIYRGQEIIGYVHGVNQKGRYGGIQVFLALTPGGAIRGFYVQKITGRGARQFRSPEFGGQFTGLKLEDFSGYQVQSGIEDRPGPVGKIKNPAPEAEDDFRAILRAVKKNLVLMDFLVLNQPGKDSGRQQENDNGPARGQSCTSPTYSGESK